MNELLLALSLLRLDLETGRIEADHWDAAEAVPMGSLAKPFRALAYAQSHGFRYPKLRCAGGCWRPSGHGELGIEDAIAHSCNRYFEQLDRIGLEATAARFGLASLDRAAPEAILRAYAELLRRREEPGVAPLLEGMRRAAEWGTAAMLGLPALAKTGTAPCTHHPKAPGDGFAVIFYPAQQPRQALLVRLHGRPGSHAAARARTLLQP